MQNSDTVVESTEDEVNRLIEYTCAEPEDDGLDKDVQIIKDSLISKIESADPELNQNDGVVPETESDVVFTVAESGSQRGCRLLLDSRGYSYTVKLYGKTGTWWWCSMRNRTKRCLATVKQMPNGFRIGKKEHSHEPKPKTISKVNIYTEIKRLSKSQINDTARNIVAHVIRKHCDSQTLLETLPSTATLIRLANRARETLRPTHPKNLNFKINEEFMPEDFIKGDMHCDADHHILMATTDQLSILADTKIWLVDCTNKFVRKPFTHLLTIQTFIRLQRDLHTIPLAFVLMSNNRMRDYNSVLELLLKILPHRHRVRKCILPLKIPLWKAFKSNMPRTSLQGCSFHWIQEVQKKSQKTLNDAIQLQVLALVYLPPEEIKEALTRIEKNTKKCPAAQSLIQYVRKQWVNHAYWEPKDWSTFDGILRTTEAVEGWQDKMDKADETVGLYKLVNQLHTVSIDIPLQWKLVSEGKLNSAQRSQDRFQPNELFRLWRKYLKSKITVEELLDGCTYLDYPLP
ncbi:uncharacterized protein [Antedon mediterranea]|uniref:uncharacterized protein n=1 Tax=Antedon mediterranea TaxID=105859 RepID=UPI003AF902E4